MMWPMKPEQNECSVAGLALLPVTLTELPMANWAIAEHDPVSSAAGLTHI